MKFTVLIFVSVTITSTSFADQTTPEYVKQCSRSDPKLEKCLIDALHHLRPYLRVGIREIELPSVEPFQMDELSLSLTDGPNGYRVSLKNLRVTGASNFTVDDIKRGSNFEATVRMPALALDADYSSSGILLILPANGNGKFHANFGRATAKVSGTVTTTIRNGKTYLHVVRLNVVLSVEDVNMRVVNTYRNNIILTQAMNLFLRQYGHDVLKAMEPELKRKLSALFAGIVNQLLHHVPVEMFLLP